MSDVSASVEMPRIDDRDWSQLTLGQRIQQLEVEGYVVLPDLLDANHIARLKAQTSQLETTHVDYSVHQRGRSSIQFAGGAISELIAYPPMIEFLKELCGDQVVLMSYDYSRSEPGHPGISLHCDGQPWGSQIFSAEYTCPKIIRVLYYLDDLIPEVSPFPRSAEIPSEFPQRGKSLPALRGTPRRDDGDVQGGCCGAVQQLCFPRQLSKHWSVSTRGTAAFISTDLGRTRRRGGALGQRRSCQTPPACP